MNAKNLTTTLVTCMKNKLPVLIKGAPGIGKSDIVAQVAAKLKMDVILSHPVVDSPIDYKGLPAVVEKKATFLPFGNLDRAVNAKKPTIYFMDDLGQAPACVQAAAMQLILARRVNGHAVSDNVVFVAATNRRTDRAGVTGILEPVKSRFATILQLDADEDSWIDWALQNDIPGEVIGFVHFRPSLLHTEESTADIVNHPCPRTIANAGKLINAGLDDVETLAGALGEGCAIELVGFMEVYKSLPDIKTILTKPDNAKVPTEPAALYAVVSALTENITKDNADQILKYGNRLPADFSVLLVRDCIRKEPKIQNTKQFIKWATIHKDMLL